MQGHFVSLFNAVPKSERPGLAVFGPGLCSEASMRSRRADGFAPPQANTCAHGALRFERIFSRYSLIAGAAPVRCVWYARMMDPGSKRRKPDTLTAATSFCPAPKTGTATQRMPTRAPC
jgi:hypothetical protein